MKWAAGMHANPDPRHLAIYRKAAISQAFPAYKLHEIDEAPARELLLALELLSLARKAQS